MVAIAREVPEVKSALAMISLETSRFIESLDASVRIKSKTESLTSTKLPWTSDEYKEITEATSTVLSIRMEPLT